jgi:ribosomal protein L31E
MMDKLIVDGASEQTGPKSEFMKMVRYLKIKLRQTEPYSPWQNDAKRKIDEVKKQWRHHMITKKVP